jgi:uncharacterized membrane protein
MKAGTQAGLMTIAVAIVGFLALTNHARADLTLCNRMSYIAEVAIATGENASVTTRGFFRLDPGQCQVVLPGAIAANAIYLHARVPAIYGAAPVTPSGSVDFCVGTGSFVIANAQKCSRLGQTLARFSAVRPSETDKGLVATLAEEAEYNDTQARDAGIQRLLVVAGYDANPIDGIRGEKTDAVLIQFLKDHNLPPTAAGRTDFFDILLNAAQKPVAGFSWCNDTHASVMAAIGFEDKDTIVTRGWYRVEPGKCVHPDLAIRQGRLYSYAEAVDADGQPIRHGERVVAWGGEKLLCTRAMKFEITDQTDCPGRGLTASPFAAVELSGTGPTVVRFR